MSFPKANKSIKSKYRPLETSSSLYQTYDNCTSNLNNDGSLTATTNTTSAMTTLNPQRVTSSSTMRYHSWTKTSSTRKFLAFGVLISLLFCYLTWASLATDNQPTAYNQSYQDGFSTNNVNESLNVCTEVFTDGRQYIDNRPRREFDQLPVIYFITPTYSRREQIAELTRLAHTLLHVPRLHWIVANDFKQCNMYLDVLLNKFGIPFTHLASPMPDPYRKKKPMPRGVANRRAALNWLRSRNITSGGVLYFGDDDNTYDLRLFSEIRHTQRVSMFPVSLIGHSVSSPVVRGGKVIGFLDEWVAERHWPVDMAGFAVNLAYMSNHPNAGMPYKPGYEEDFFLRSIGLKLDLIEPKGNNCTVILVWHTQTKNHERSTIRIDHDYLDDRSNLGALFLSLERMGVATTSDTEGAKAVVSKNGKVKSLNYFFS